jgi:hypothetical protein
LECSNGPDVIKIPNIKLTMSPDICLNAIEPNKAADLIYSAEFKNGHLEGDNFANSTALFINKQPKKCPINLCVIN